jgi:hypothetical protein
VYIYIYYHKYAIYYIIYYIILCYIILYTSSYFIYYILYKLNNNIYIYYTLTIYVLYTTLHYIKLYSILYDIYYIIYVCVLGYISDNTMQRYTLQKKYILLHNILNILDRTHFPTISLVAWVLFWSEIHIILVMWMIKTPICQSNVLFVNLPSCCDFNR